MACERQSEWKWNFPWTISDRVWGLIIDQGDLIMTRNDGVNCDNEASPLQSPSFRSDEHEIERKQSTFYKIYEPYNLKQKINNCFGD